MAMSPPTDPQTGRTITTICCVGFPSDFSDREWQNSFLHADGFELSTIQRTPNGGMLGFARFTTYDQATQAITRMNGKVLDVKLGSVARCSMAQKQLDENRLKRKPATLNPTDPALIAPEPKFPRRSREEGNGRHIETPPVRYSFPPAILPIRPPGTKGDTLYITGFSASSTEAEVKSYLEACGGFVQLKWTPRPGRTPLCFAKFVDENMANNAVTHLNGYPLPSTNGVPLSVAIAHTDLEIKDKDSTLRSGLGATLAAALEYP